MPAEAKSNTASVDNVSISRSLDLATQPPLDGTLYIPLTRPARHWLICINLKLLPQAVTTLTSLKRPHRFAQTHEQTLSHREEAHRHVPISRTSISVASHSQTCLLARIISWHTTKPNKNKKSGKNAMPLPSPKKPQLEEKEAEKARNAGRATQHYPTTHPLQNTQTRPKFDDRNQNRLNLTPPAIACPPQKWYPGKPTVTPTWTHTQLPQHTQDRQTDRQQQQRFHCTPAPEFPEMLCQPSPDQPPNKDNGI